MNKKVLSLVLGTMLVTSISYAAPAAAVEEGQTTIGYDHYNLSHSQKDDNFYLQHGLSSKFAVGVEQNSYSNYQEFKTTDITAQYKLDKNVYLTAGDRSYSDDSFSNKFIYGVGANVNLAPKVDGYASVTASSVSTEWQTGLLYKLDNQTALHLGYKSYKDDLSSTKDGVGFGINYTF